VDLVSVRDLRTQESKGPNFIKDKGKTPMASSSHSFHDKKNCAYLYAHAKNSSHNARNAHHDVYVDHDMHAMHHVIVYSSYAMTASSSSSHAHGKPRHRASHAGSHAPKDKNASHGPYMLFRTFDAFFVIYCKNDKVFASHVGPKCKKGKTCIWVSKAYVTNLIEPKSS
jgi:hypothetical protein